MVDLRTLPGAPPAQRWALTTGAGLSANPIGRAGLLTPSCGKQAQFGTLSSLLGTTGVSAAYGITASGDIVGACRFSGGSDHGFLLRSHSDGIAARALRVHLLSRSRTEYFDEPLETKGIAMRKGIAAHALRCVFAVWATISPAADQPRYTVTDLGTLGGVYSIARGINERGQVVGYATLPNWEPHAFLWEDGRMTDLGTAGRTSGAEGINERSQVVGRGDLAPVDATVGALLWDQDRVTYLTSGTAQAINDHGQVLGWMESAQGRGPFLWQSGGLKAISTCPPGYGALAARSINKQGQVVASCTGGPQCRSGQRCVSGFVWDNGKLTSLGSLGGTVTYPGGINESGEVAGSAEIAGGAQHAFLWRNGEMADLGTFGGYSASAIGINKHAQVVGEFYSGAGLHAFVWRRGIFTDLGTAGESSSAWAVNDRGQIVGYATVNGNTHAVLWQPQKD